jgi:hypothetical protein
LAIGMLIGIEESDSRCQSAEEECAIGIRTLGVVGLLGGLTVQFGNSSLVVFVAVWTVLMALKALVECLRSEAARHPDDRELHDDWRASCRDLDLAAAALAKLLGDRHAATWFRKRARP